MKKEELQQMICAVADNEVTCAQMLEIATGYLRGDVLYDPVAAEAWLLRVIERGDSVEAVRATALLAREIYRRDVPISEADYADLQRALERAGEKEREVIAEWMKVYEKIENS